MTDAHHTPVMTVKETAAYLRVSTATVYKLARSGDMPAARIGRSWRFRRDLIDAWLREQTVQTDEDATR